MTVGKLMMIIEFVKTLNNDVEITAVLGALQQHSCKMFYKENYGCGNCVFNGICIETLNIRESKLKGIIPE